MTGPTGTSQAVGEGSSAAVNLPVTRRQRKAAITRHLGSLSRHIAEGKTKLIHERLDKMQASFTEFEQINDAYLATLTEESDLDESEAWFAEIEGRYIAGVTSANDWLHENEQLTSGNHGNVSTDQGVAAGVNKDILSMLTIPKLEIDTFSGNPLEYQSFMAIFDECVGNKVSDDQIKLTRLLQYTSGPAKAAIRNCSLTGGSLGYSNAREILKSRFGNDHIISRKIIDDLTSGKSVSKPSDIRQLADDLAMAEAALGSLKMTSEVDNQSTILNILKRCPKPVQSKWRTKALEIKRDTDNYPNFSKFVEFVTKTATDWCDPVYGGDALKASNLHTKMSSVNTVTAEPNASVSPNVQPNAPVSHNDNGRLNQRCSACNASHRLIYCGVFRAMSPRDRFQFCKDKRLCYNCLMPNHVATKCKSQYVCTVQGCGKRHSKFLHYDTTNSATNQSANVQSADDSVNCGSTSAFGSSVYLPIVPVLVNGVKTYCLLDNGSTNTFITETLSNRLNLQGSRHVYNMRTIDSVKRMNSKVVNFNVSALDGSFSQDLTNVVVNSSIPAKYPTEQIDLRAYPHLADIPLSPIGKGTPVEVVIGMDNSHLLLPLQVRYNAKSLNEPYATRSVFGWALQGHLGNSTLSEITSNFIQLEHKLDRMWEIENDDFDYKLHSVEDRNVVELWDREIKHENGHYVLPIPWRNGHADLPNNKFIAKCRLDSLTRRLEKTDLTEVYDQNIQKMISSGYAERVPQNEITLNDGTVWYIPHHPVLKKAGKVRPVFDCSAKFRGVSLNSECLQGPNLTNNLVNVLLRFRQYKYALMADIESMYLQVRILEPDRNALRFLWYDKLDDCVVEYRMTSHLFGGVWCAASNAYALRRTVLDCEPPPLIADTILRSFYVDDMLKSVKDFDEACEIIHGTRRVLSHGGFNLTKFVTNDRVLLEQIDGENRATEIKQIIPDMYFKALGIQWEISGDSFHYCYKGTESIVVNRRHMLSRTMSMYDPLGLITPTIFQGKVLFQEATRLQLNWDQPVPNGLHDKWCAWLQSLKTLDQLRFQRCLIPRDFEDAVFEIHTFCDASTAGYGACCYLRAINQNGCVRVTLVASKGRLAPIKQITIPRLELCAAVTAVKLDRLVRSELDIDLTQS